MKNLLKIYIKMIKNVWLYADSRNSEASNHKKLVGTIFKSGGLNVQENPNEDTDLCFCVGGDGSILSGIRQLESTKHSIPIGGMHSSSGLGFLHSIKTPSESSEIKNFIEYILQAILEQKFKTEERYGLDGHLKSKDAEDKDFWAMNDLALGKGSLSRMIKLKVSINDHILFERMQGDGLIIASPTGSTAYSLSAGGPILAPGLKAVLLNPICPHEIAHRPMVLDSKCLLKITVLNGRSACHLTEDGQNVHDLSPGDEISIQRSERPILWWTPTSPNLEVKSYFEVLRTKLGLGGKA